MIYDTRLDRSINLPLSGWLFPCINCGDITGSLYKRNIGKILNSYIDIPVCSKCIKVIDLEKIKIYKKYIKIQN